MSVTPEETLSTLRAISAEAKRLQAEQAARLRNVAAQIVAERLRSGQRAWLIGSLAWGGFGETSDIDLVIDEMDEPTAVELEIALTRATARQVDVLQLTELARPFQARVLKEGLPLHGG